MAEVEIRHFHLFAGLGGGARGFNRGEARVGNLQARFRCLGGIDVDPSAVRDFKRLAGVPGMLLDLFDRSQYRAYHGREPGPEWREATPEDIRRAAGHERPHIIFLSPPCKGYSGLLAEKRSKTDKYQALNQLALRGMWLALEAWADDPVELIILENVPRMATRGRGFLDRITGLLRSYGYAVAETTHDCGKLGGLAQSRKRFLLVARHVEKVPPFLYEPMRRPLRAVGDVLGKFPLPGDERAGIMHHLPRLQWRTWVRLAFVEAGGDWRSLSRLRVQDGVLADYLIIPEARRSDYMGVLRWQEPAGAISGRGGPTNGRYSVADPRVDGLRHNNVFRVVRWRDVCPSVTGGTGPTAGGLAVADPRVGPYRGEHYGVQRWDSQSRCIPGRATYDKGQWSVADPRVGFDRGPGDHYLTGGHYGVIPWDAPSGAVSAAACHDNGRWSVADPRLPGPSDQLVAVIRALDGTWHRPFTTLELAALQGLVDPEEHLELEGLSDSAWRERIGNAVPPPAAQAIAGVMGTTLLLAWSGETFAMGSTPIWVRPMVAALQVVESTGYLRRQAVCAPDAEAGQVGAAGGQPEHDRVECCGQ